MKPDFDLIVLGGGPGGSTVATLVAMQGHRVLLLEQDKFPRHQIGESLLPATVHGICPMLGVKEEIDQAGFPRKRGGTFRWGKNPTPWTFTFTRNPDSPTGYAYQVERSRFDAILLNNARRKGVDVREEHAATDVIMDGDRVAGVRFKDAAGQERTATARFVVGSQGFRSSMHQLAGERIYSRFFQNVALYGYFEGGKRLPAPNQGNILSAAFEHGWFWYIPLSDTLTSVGAVVSREMAERIKGGHEEAFRSFVDACPIMSEYLAPARRVTQGEYGEFRVRKDYSYCNTRFWRPGLALIGDAACFIDPVFSSGVHLATYAGLLAARSINTCLQGDLDEPRCFLEFEYRYRREFSNFYQFLIAFYDMHKEEDSYFWAARKILNTEEAGNTAFVRLISGLSTSHLLDGEQAPDDTAHFFEDREGMGDWFHGMLLETAEGMSSRPEGPGRGRPSPGRGFRPESFMQELTSELSQVQRQARLKDHRPSEAPLVRGGLVPSKDGLHWQEVERGA